MRRLVRAACPPSVLTVLAARQAKVDGGASVAEEWKSFSKLVAYRDLRNALQAPLGARRRCCYCSDSLGADVEHFWPKDEYVGKAFDFDNFLIACPACNRKKLARFPLDAAGLPLLVNPVFDDPWDSLYFVPTTGLIDARIVAADGAQVTRSPKGIATLEVLGDQINGDPARIARQRN